MQKYGFRIIETLTKDVIVEADSYTEAFERIESAYENEDVVLGASNFSEVEFRPEELEELFDTTILNQKGSIKDEQIN